jgi:flagellar biosynthesis GTPase FlhF
MKRNFNKVRGVGDFDERGLLVDGGRYRASVTMLDSAPVRDTPRRPLIGDGTTDQRQLGLHKPGWRVPAQDARTPLLRSVFGDAQRQAAYDAYDERLENQWRGDAVGDAAQDARRKRSVKYDPRGRLEQTVETEEETDDDDELERQTSDHRRDHRTVAQMMRDHQNKMADIYDKLDHELSETWRRS